MTALHLGDWVTLPNGQPGQLWAKSNKRNHWWIATGNQAHLHHKDDLKHRLPEDHPHLG